MGWPRTCSLVENNYLLGLFLVWFFFFPLTAKNKCQFLLTPKKKLRVADSISASISMRLCSEDYNTSFELFHLSYFMFHDLLLIRIPGYGTKRMTCSFNISLVLSLHLLYCLK